jgi:hypothetical protein
MLSPRVVQGVQVPAGTLIAQDVTQIDCNAGEDRWRVRFINTGATSVTFSGSIRIADDNNDTLSVAAVGACPAGDLGGNRRLLDYSCAVADTSTPDSGYDICLPAGNRLTFFPEADNVPTPTFVFVGAAGFAPPSPDPFTIRVDVGLGELQSSLDLHITNTAMTIQGNNQQEGSIPLNPEQVSLEPLCGPPAESVQPRVRLNGNGEYTTTRFSGSSFVMDDVEFTQVVQSLDGSARFPTGGGMTLLTRVEDELENSEIVQFMDEICLPTVADLCSGNVVQSLADVTVNVQEVNLDFPDQVMPLTVE